MGDILFMPFVGGSDRSATTATVNLGHNGGRSKLPQSPYSCVFGCMVSCLKAPLKARSFAALSVSVLLRHQLAMSGDGA